MDFSGSTFKAASSFKGCQFWGGAIFDDVRFHVGVFEFSKFMQSASFSHAVFRTVASFRNARFERDVSFAATRFGDVAVFEDAVFKQSPDWVSTLFARAANGPPANRPGSQTGRCGSE
ncbi:pentapeptide repeat-containing protein [Rhodococcus sp. I2R]|nr:pentapeptide repeat-containing protein [Rhodococcus sp. I2R]